MAVELGASRLLAPYFSSSQIVWTIIIATIMIAMALGNLYGGRSADRHPEPDRLYRRLLIAAVWIAAIPLAGRYVIVGISGLLVFTVSHQLLVIAAFLSCMVIFVYPCFLLGTVTPSLVKYSVDSLDDSGRTVGNLGAFNTVGSILGTFLPTFVTIPAVGTAVTFLLFSAVLLALGLVYFLSCRRRLILCAVCTVLFILCAVFGSGAGFAFWEKDLAYEGESVYNYLQVREDENNVSLSTNVLFGVQSVLKKDGRLSGMYYDYAMAAPVMARAAGAGTGEVLVLGMGSGTYDHQCRAFFDGLHLTGVEIDEKITDLAHTYFELPEEAEVAAYDGRAYLAAVEQSYDVILVDAYQDITIPFQMSSLEFFRLVAEHLTPGGVMAVNMNMRSGSEGSINAYLQDTIAAVFPWVATVDVPYYTNRVLFAAASAPDEGAYQTALGEMASHLDTSRRLELTSFLSAVPGRLTVYEPGALLLTDDRAPVELLGMRVIDELIAEELAYYRAQGPEGLLSLLQ
ncbi:MAG: fused MFS/spermidine synthase [Oscillospiraceae bacterium]|nr:fused MFS/spermidine synthase [Oscillospiraceae bacterium]